jgi:thiol-disulfide isomerase/thioredoxin
MPTLNRGALALLAAMIVAGCSKPPEPLPVAPGGGWKADVLEAWDAGRLLAAAAVDGREALVVALWAHWCEPCIAEMAELSQLAAARPTWGVLGLVTDDLGSPTALTRVQAVLGKVKPTHSQGRIQPGGEFRLLEALGLEWDGILPKTFVVTRAGTFLLAGRTKAELTTEVERILQSGAATPARSEGAGP